MLPLSRGGFCALIGLSCTFSLLLVGCVEGDKSDPSGDSGGGSEGADGDDGSTGEDGGGQPAPAFVVEGLVDVVPLTLEAAAGGTVMATIRAEALREDGERVELAEAISGRTFEAIVPSVDGTGETAESPLTVEPGVDADGRLTLSFTLPPEPAETGRRAVISILVDGAPLVELPLGLSVSPDPMLESMRGEIGAHLDQRTASGTLCHAAVVDADEDGRVELLTVRVDGTKLRATGCTQDPEGRGWVCVDEDLSSGKDVLCGTTDHFRFAEGGVGIAGVVEGAADHQMLQFGPIEWDGTNFVGGAEVGAVTSAALFGAVLGLNTTKEKAPTPLTALLAVDETSSRWGGTYEENGVPWEWTSVGGVTAEQVGTGAAWAGVFTHGDLSGEGGEDSYLWAIDPTGIASGGTLRVGIADYIAGVGFVRVKDIQVEPPPFEIEAATLSGQDLDEDGHGDVLVEVWGEGQWAGYLILGATNKAGNEPVRTLVGQGGTAWPARLSGNGPAVAEGSFHLNEEGILQGTFSTLVGMEGDTNGSPTALLTHTERWDVATVLLEDADLVPATGGGFVGQVPLSGALTVGGPRGMCLHGKCFALPGYAGHDALVAGGGSGEGTAGSVLEGLAPGDFIFVGEEPGGGAIIPLVGEGAESLATHSHPVRSAVGGSTIERMWDSGGPALAIEGTVRLYSRLDSIVGSRLEADGVTVSAWSFEPQFARPREGGPVEIRYAVQFASSAGNGWGILPEETTLGGSSVPVLLSETVSAETGCLLGWRDGAGQLWLGVVDIAGSAGMAGEVLSFLQGPVALGTPLGDARGGLGLSVDRPGVVGMRRSIADTPFLSMEDLEKRFSTWDEPMEVPFAEVDAPYGPLVVVTGSPETGAEVVHVAAFSDLGSLSTTRIASPTSDLSEFPVPVLSASLVPEAPPIVVSVSAGGKVRFDLVDGRQPLAGTMTPLALELGWPGGVTISAGDINGDGISDLVYGAGSHAGLFLSDGRGGQVADGGAPTRQLTNFAILLGAGGRGDECDLDEEGGSPYVLGQSFWGGSR